MYTQSELNSYSMYIRQTLAACGSLAFEKTWRRLAAQVRNDFADGKLRSSDAKRLFMDIDHAIINRI